MQLFKKITVIQKISLTIEQLRHDLFTELDTLEATAARAAALRAKIERYKTMLESGEDVENYALR